MKDSENLLDIDGAAEFLNFSRWTTYRLAREGFIETVRFGRLVRFDPDKLREYVKNGGREKPEERPAA